MANSFIENISPPKRERLQDHIVSQLKKIILQGQVDVGEKLPSERDLAQMMGVSRAVIKQALISLNNAGFIEIKSGPKGGAFVVEKFHLPVLNTFFDLLEWGNLTLEHFVQCRQALEIFIVPILLENIQGHHFIALENINNKVMGALSDKSLLRKYNMEFHLFLSEIAGNNLITLCLRSLFSTLDAFLPESIQEKEFIISTHKRHEEIIQTLKERDIERCQELLIQDVSHTSYLR